jgi:hypothetical protein
LFALGEASSQWYYYLGDGRFSVRQLVDGSGSLALSRTLRPCSACNYWTFDK